MPLLCMDFQVSFLNLSHETLETNKQTNIFVHLPSAKTINPPPQPPPPPLFSFRVLLSFSQQRHGTYPQHSGVLTVLNTCSFVYDELLVFYLFSLRFCLRTGRFHNEDPTLCR